MAFSPDGKRIASGSGDNTVRVWDAATGQPVGQPLTGHTDAVFSVAFSPDGTRIASGGDDNTVRVWDAATGQPIGQPLTGHTDAVFSVAFSPDGAAHRLRQWRQHRAGVARLRRRRGGVRQAHHQYEPPAVAGLGVARYRLHRSLSGTADPGRRLTSKGAAGGYSVWDAAVSLRRPSPAGTAVWTGADLSGRLLARDAWRGCTIPSCPRCS